MARTLPRVPTRGKGAWRYKRSATHLHRGVDIQAPEGTPVYAVADGRVTHARAELGQGFSGYGGHVVLDTSKVGRGPWVLYAHLSGVDVAPGAVVSRGEQIGAVGRTCFSRADPQRLCGGAHLHFEVSPRPYPQASEAERIDPVGYLAARDAHPMAPGSAGQAALPPLHPGPTIDDPGALPPIEEYSTAPTRWARQPSAAWLLAAGAGLLLLSLAAAGGRKR